TNVAAFLSQRPDLKAKVDRIVLMGGSMGLGNTTPAAEFNVYVDPEAARAVFESGLPVTMAGLDVTHRAGAGPGEVARMREAGRVGAVAAELVTFFAGTYEKIYGFPAPPIHDAVAVAAVLQPNVLETRRMRVDVECGSELTRGETVCDLYDVTGKEPNAEVGVGLDRERFFEILFEALGRL
ncbi:MAG: nucleoside hydrolase, partial [Rubrobacter sp.]